MKKIPVFFYTYGRCCLFLFRRIKELHFYTTAKELKKRITVRCRYQ